MARDGLGFRAIGRATGVSHNTIINWVKQSEADQSNTLEADETSDPMSRVTSEVRLDYILTKLCS